MPDSAATELLTEPPKPSAGELQDLLLSTESVEHFLQQLSEVAVSTIGAGVSAGVTVARDGHPATVASSDRYAAQLDELQYGPDLGPCLTAMRAGKIVLIGDMAGDERFTSFRLRALALGARSSMSLPLTGGDSAVGALNLYSRHAHTFGATEQAQAQRFAAEASRALTLAVRLFRHVEITDQLRAALTSRTVIDQAIGIIMGQNRCSSEHAFSVLRNVSQNRNVRLRFVATEIVTAVGKTEPTTGHTFTD